MQYEWGPWIEHDGKGCPVPVGTVVLVRLRCGELYQGVAGCSGYGDFAKPHGHENDPILSLWVHGEYSRPVDVVRYRVRKPRALSMLQRLVADLPADRPVTVDA